MRCPYCSAADTRVADSRLASDGDQVRRRRECLSCKERFTTYESAEISMPRVVKNNDQREPFNEQKLRAGLLRALEKRPVGSDQIELSITALKRKLSAQGLREVSSRAIGDLVMDALKKLDDVAYVRFASVYRKFEDVSDFRDMIDGLETDADTRL
ncbi:MAG: transcriptional regulator NrdR [Gammaproteobacteria bacterium]|nr:transcriptional regulator NrdR [Gammaproteobacteria bacterium]